MKSVNETGRVESLNERFERRVTVNDHNQTVSKQRGEERRDRSVDFSREKCKRDEKRGTANDANTITSESKNVLIDGAR